MYRYEQFTVETSYLVRTQIRSGTQVPVYVLEGRVKTAARRKMVLSGKHDVYGGVVVSASAFEEFEQDGGGCKAFSQQLTASVAAWRQQDKRGIWRVATATAWQTAFAVPKL